MGRINDVLIIANRNYVPIDFIVLDIDCNPLCPIILGRPFLRTIGAIIDMKEGNIITHSRKWQESELQIWKVTSGVLHATRKYNQSKSNFHN